MDPRFEQLKRRARSTFGDAPVEATVQRVRAIIGPVRFATNTTQENALVQLADEGLEALRSNQVPDASQYAALQIMIRLARPSILSRGGQLGPFPRPPQGFAPTLGADVAAGGATDADLNALDSQADERQQTWDAFRSRADALLPAIGRIDADARPMGTGFLAAPGLLLTNRHVLEQISFGSLMLDPGQAQVRFGQEDRTVDTFPAVDIVGVTAVAEGHDLALLELGPGGPAAPPMPPPLVFSDRGLQAGDEVVAVGYPVKDDRNSPTMMDRIFEGKYGVKRAAPGEVMEVGTGRVFHDCSTLGGNSGSPVLAMDTAEVVAVHSSGFFTWRNEAVTAEAARAFVTETTGGGP